MNKNNVILILSAFLFGLSINNFAMSDNLSRIAVVDVNKVLNGSSQIIALRKEQNLKKEELQKWLKTAKADIDKQQTQEGKSKLAAKYNQELAKKQQAAQKDYVSKLNKIDKSISDVIANEAKTKGYSVVIAKSSVLYGGLDITNEIVKLVK